MCYFLIYAVIHFPFPLILLQWFALLPSPVHIGQELLSATLTPPLSNPLPLRHLGEDRSSLKATGALPGGERGEEHH